jgi:hypothetical protein
MGDEIQTELLVIATIARRGEAAGETLEFTIWHGDGGPSAVQAAVVELERRRGRPLEDAEWLSFLNVHPNRVECERNTVAICVYAQGERYYHASLQLDGCKTRQELLRAALARYPAAVRTGAVEYFCVNPGYIDISD